MIVLCNWNLYG